MMTFCTAVNCMDGRVQRPVIDYLSEFFGVEPVDVVTEAGPVAVLKSRYPGLPVVALWVDESWSVSEVTHG